MNSTNSKELDDLNDKTLELLRAKLKREKSVIVICITASLENDQYSQLVGYGIKMPLIADAMQQAWNDLNEELSQKEQRE